MGPAPGDSSAADKKDNLSTTQCVARMLAMAWRYRWGCVQVLTFNLLLLVLGLAGLGFMGTGVDYIRYIIPPASSAAPDTLSQTLAPAHGAQSPVHMSDTASAVAQEVPSPQPHVAHAKPPRWPLGIAPPSSWGKMTVLLAIGAAIILVALLRAVITMFSVVVVQRFVQGKIVVDLRAAIYEKLQRLSFRFFDANVSGSIINRVTGDVQGVRLFIDGVVIQTVTIVLSLAIYIVYMTRIHAGLTAACLASTPVLWFLTVRFSRTVRPKYRENRKLFDSLILALSENIQGVHVVKGFARQKEQIEKFCGLNAHYRDQQFWIFRKIAVFQPLIGFITQFNLVVMLAYGGYLVVRYESAPDAATAAVVGLSVGQLLIFSGLLQQFSSQVSNISNIANSVQQSLIAAQRVFDVIDTKVEILSPPNPVHMSRCKGEISFENVCFSYNPGEPVLEDLNFSIKPGSCAAVVGQTGSGKSTLLSLIPRFYDPQSGLVRIDGTDIRRLRVEDLRRSIGIVFQESFLFSNTIAANIAFGHPDATREQIERAAKIAAAHDFIMALSKGYDTVLQEGGSNLSGGQRQRLTIARALLLEPPVLLLDDPLAAVDPETEKEILVALDSAMEGRTSVIVAHRLSTLQRADSVIVLNRGRMVESGTHEELMKASGHYSRAAQLQVPDQESLQILNEGGPAV